jgi:hypothetical protein
MLDTDPDTPPPGRQTKAPEACSSGALRVFYALVRAPTIARQNAAGSMGLAT